MSTTTPPEAAAVDDDSTPATAADVFAARGRTPLQRIQHVLHGHPALSPLLVLAMASVVFASLNSRFAEAGSISLVLQQAAIIAALAIGQTLIVLTAGIDLSVGAVMVLAMMVSATLHAESGLPAPVAILLGIAIGTACGALNGLLVTRLKLPPFIATLGTLSVFTALTLLYTKGQSIQASDMDDLMLWTGNVIRFGDFTITYGVVIVVVLYLAFHFALTQTRWGTHVYAVGDDPEAARLAGISVDRVLLSVYAVAGLVFGLTAWLMIGRASAAGTNAVPQANLESITAVVIGGTSLFGGRGTLAGTAVGALIVYAFNSGLSLAGVDQNYRILAIGVLVIVAVSIDQWIRKVRA
ncbi:ABC transporter permease [Nocardioides okcheonensis]|uniref:ABC transporter permease n=1 Tax=Nocardioides okcheonensis TaxID=2894081 RepID=UPI001E430EDB|nr:ABC transporter permease [Nocardioides okcheonensis]UFN42906.1 ABC transporter permease [Nocardioides okcheonensis]